MEFLTLILFFMSIYFLFSIRSLKKSVKMQSQKISELQNKEFKEAMDNDKLVVFEESTEENSFMKKEVISKDLLDLNLENEKDKITEHDINKKEKVISKLKKKSNEIADKKRKIFSVESIITKLGILLLLIGVGFIFKYSYDNGILTEKVVLIIGAVFGIVLMTIGEFVRRKSRELLSQVLYGGGVATLFITTYSAYQVYGFISSYLAFVIMSILTIITFLIAIHLDSMIMSIIGLLGGLLTPFFVDLKFLGIYGLGLYMIFLSIASMIIYVYKKWRALQISVICGIYLITIYLIDLSGGDIIKSYQLSALIIILYIIFNSVEYGLTYLSKNRNLDKLAKPILLGMLPIITIGQLTQILEISNTKWSIVCLVFSIVYLILWELLFRKNNYSIITDILLAVSAVFLLFACALYFEGAILAMSIVALSLLLSFVGEKRGHKYSRFASYFIFAIGFISGFSSMMFEMYEYEYEWLNLVGHLMFLVLIVVATMIQKNKIRMIYGVLSIELYFILFTEAIVWQLTKSNDNNIISMTITYGFCLALIALFNKYKSMVPKLSISILSLLVIVFKMLLIVPMIWHMDFKLYDFFGFIIYSVLVYSLSLYKGFEWKTVDKLLLKITSLVIIMITMLVDIYILMDAFAYGLLIVGVINILVYYFEVDKDLKSIMLLGKILNISWIFLVFMYTVSGFYRQEFDILLFIVDGGLIITLFFILKNLKIKQEIRFIFHWLIYIILVNQNFESLEFGSATTTLLWAAYAITSLTFAVKKNEKNIANIALLMIVFVAGKFVIVDLGTASILWKIVTSMVFGSALLVISYVLQPMFAKKE